jgi:RNA-directed DNA polymerase
VNNPRLADAASCVCESEVKVRGGTAERRKRSKAGRAAGSRSASQYRGGGGTDPRNPAEGKEHRNTGTFEGKMAETSGSTTVSTKLERIAKLARAMPQVALTTLAHHIDIEWLREAYRRTRKSGATGVDRQTADEYATKLEENLRSLLERAQAGSYVAPPVRRVHIPKGDGSQTRPIGIPTFEDKILQRAVAMVLEAVYEQSFLDCSYGFRPGRSAHQALQTVQNQAVKMAGRWVLEVDIKNFFDTLDHCQLRDIVHKRVRDGVILRLISKWLNAGVMEDGGIEYPDAGTPQGGVISPLLANVYLHEVLDEWFARDVVPRLVGRAVLVRYADDVVIIFSCEGDAHRVADVLPKRFARYGLTLHPQKTRLVDFRRPDRRPLPSGENDAGHVGPGTFDLLGFTHYWARSRKGYWVVKQKTAKDRLRRSIKRVAVWCRLHRQAPVRDQWNVLRRKLLGHFAYFGITGNYPALHNFRCRAIGAWQKWLSRRSQRTWMSREKMERLLARYPLPEPRLRRIPAT